METLPARHVGEKRDGPLEHAAYALEEGEARRHVSWLCRECAHQHGSHTRFAAAMVKRGDFAWLASWPGTSYGHSHTV